MDKDLQAEITASCMRLLSRREHSQSELLRKLSVKGYEVANIQVVIDEFSNEGWQSDQRFAAAFFRQRIQNGFGPVRIDFEFKQRGVDMTCADLEFEGRPAWSVVITEAYAKKYLSDQRQISSKEWAKRSRYLQQRGFSGWMIKDLFDQLGLSFE